MFLGWYQGMIENFHIFIFSIFLHNWSGPWVILQYPVSGIRYPVSGMSELVRIEGGNSVSKIELLDKERERQIMLYGRNP